MPDGQSNVDATILKLAEQYQSTLVRSRALNEERATIRENCDKLGVDPKAFQVALMMTRDMTTGERSDYTGSLNRVLGVLDGKESDLFGAEFVEQKAARIKKREEKAAGRPRDGKALDAATDANKRSDPASGGAGKRGRKGKGDNVVQLNPPTTADVDKQIKDTAARKNAEAEQREGEEIFDRTNGAGAAPPVDNDGENQAPKSQSDIAAERREAAFGSEA